MKKMNLFLAIAGICASASMAASVDVTPANWRFDQMETGSADKLFIREASAIGANFQVQVLPDGRKGFRYADELPGGFSVAHWIAGGVSLGYADMTEMQKQDLETFYKSFCIANGGEMGNIMIYQGMNSTAIDSRAVKNSISMGTPSIYVASQKDLVPGIYKIGISIRIILNENIAANNISTDIGTSWWDGLPLAGSGNSGYGAFNIDVDPQINDYWTLYEFEVEVKGGNPDAKHDFCPIMIKLGLKGVIVNNSMIMFDDFKIQKMDAITLEGKLLTTDITLSDTPTNISNPDANENVIIFANENEIQVIDAQNTIEVFNSAGELLKKVDPTSTLTKIAISQKGVYLVKTGKVIQKVIF